MSRAPLTAKGRSAVLHLIEYDYDTLSNPLRASDHRTAKNATTAINTVTTISNQCVIGMWYSPWIEPDIQV